MRKLFEMNWEWSKRGARTLRGQGELYYLLAFLTGALPTAVLAGIPALAGAIDAVSLICAVGMAGLVCFFAAYFYALRNL